MSDWKTDEEKELLTRYLPIFWSLLIGLLIGGIGHYSVIAALIIVTLLMLPVAYFYGWLVALPAGPRSPKLSVRVSYLSLVCFPWVTGSVGVLYFNNYLFWAGFLGSIAGGALAQVLLQIKPLPFTGSDEMRRENDRAFLSTIVPVDFSAGAVLKSEREAAEGKSLGLVADGLVNELITIAKTADFISSSGKSEYDTKNRHKRAREIGYELHKLGGMKLMEAAYYRVAHVVGPRRDLEYAWNYIGDWQP